MAYMDEFWQALLGLSVIIVPIGLAWLMLELLGQPDRRRNTDK